MPYIRNQERIVLDDAILELGRKIETPGQLSYAITKLSLCLIEELGECYSTFALIDGVLDCTKQEFVRRVIEPYEEQKRLTNGDVYEE